MSTPALNTKRRRNSSANKSAKRRRTTKQITFQDDEGDTIIFRLENSKLSELVNGKTTLACVTKLQINEGTGRVVDDDGESDCFRLIEKEKLSELRSLAEEAGLEVDWVAKTVDTPIEDPVKPVIAEQPAKTTEIEEPVKASAKTGNTKPKPKRKRSKSKTPRRRKTPRKPKVWDPITFENEAGDKFTFRLTEESFLQESVNGEVTLPKVTRLSINTAISRIEDEARAFTVKETEMLGPLRDMAVHAMDLNLDWSTEVPESSAWCSVM